MDFQPFVQSGLFIILGSLAGRLSLVPDRTPEVLTAVVLNITLPAVLIVTGMNTPVGASLAAMPIASVVHTLLAFAVASAVYRKMDANRKATGTMLCLGFNNGLFAFPIVLVAWGPAVLAHFAAFELVNAFVVLGVNYAVAASGSAAGSDDGSGSGSAPGSGSAVGSTCAAGSRSGSAAGSGAASGSGAGDGSRSGSVSAAAATRRERLYAGVRSLRYNYPIWAFVAGLILGSLGLSLPVSLEPTFASITGANTVLSLMLLGMFLSIDHDPARLKRSASVLFLRYGTGLVVGVTAFLLLPVSFEIRRSILLAMLLPVGLTVMPFSIRFGLDRRLAANVATAGVVVSFFIMLAIFSLL